jgi:hypothetical protein
LRLTRERRGDCSANQRNEIAPSHVSPEPSLAQQSLALTDRAKGEKGAQEGTSRRFLGAVLGDL